MKTTLFRLMATLVLVLTLAATGPASAADAPRADYSSYLTLAEVQEITGLENMTVTSVDAKKSGEAADLTFFAADGTPVLMVQVLNGSDYERYYSDLRCQDYRPLGEAFWGPKAATPEQPPTLLAFRKHDTLIVIGSGLAADNTPALKNYMFERAAKLIASRL